MCKDVYKCYAIFLVKGRQLAMDDNMLLCLDVLLNLMVRIHKAVLTFSLHYVRDKEWKLVYTGLA